MRDFLTVLLQCSVSMSLVTLAYMAILPILSKRYASKWCYIIWLVIAAGWIFPFRPRIDLSFLPMQIPDIPAKPVHPIINTISPPMAGAVDIAVKTPATIHLWLALTWIWILGIVSVIFYRALQHGHFMKIVLRWSEPVTDSKCLEILDGLRSELGIKTQIGLSACQSISSPMLVGFFHPVLLLPPIKIADDELSFILKHELIHFQRRDLWYKALILAATALHWFNPLVYLMARSAAVQCEISCDALVLQGSDFQQRKQYGETIIGVVRNGAELRTALSTNFYGGKKGMKTRISSIMDTTKKKAGFVILSIVLVAIVGTGVALAAYTADSTPKSAEDSDAASATKNAAFTPSAAAISERITKKAAGVPAEPVAQEALPEYWAMGALNVDGTPYLPLVKTAENLGYTVNISSFKIADEVPDWNPQYTGAVEYNYELSKDGKSVGIASLDISDGIVISSMIDQIFCNTHDKLAKNSFIFQKDTVYMPAQFFKEALDTDNKLP